MASKKFVSNINFIRKYEGGPNLFPLRICILDGLGAEVLEAAKELNLPILEYENDNNNQVISPESRTIYVVREFEGHEMILKFEKTPNIWILGPTALLEISQFSSLELREKPTYCTFMYGFVFYIECPKNIPLMERMVKLIKWMGGKFVSEPNIHTTHMICNNTLAEGYHYCATFGLPILSPEWVEQCWLHRHMPFDVRDIMGLFRLKPFCGLHIAFVGLDQEATANLKSLLTENDAFFVDHADSKCTHLVVTEESVDTLRNEDIPEHIIYVVTEEWFATSIEWGFKVPEEDYEIFEVIHMTKILPPQVEETLQEDCNEESRVQSEVSRSTELSNDAEDLKKKNQDQKRKYAVEDLFLKESNYFSCLKQLFEVQHFVTNNLNPDGVIIDEAEAKILFGNIEAIVHIQQTIVDHLKETLQNWRNETITVNQLVISKDKLLKEYVLYATNFKDSKDMFKELAKKNKRFRKLVEKFEVKHRVQLKDIFIRPIQRVCSLVLQIEEISKYTREDNPDKEMLNTAVQIVKDVVQKVNDSQEQQNRLQVPSTHANLQFQEFLPVTTYHGELVAQFVAQELDSDCTAGTELVFFLFKNILEIARVKSAKMKYFISPKKQVHVATIPLSMVINVIEYKAAIGKSCRELFGLKVKNVSREGATCTYCFQFLNKELLQFKDIIMLFANQLAQRVSNKSSDDFILSLSSISETSICQLTKCKENRCNMLLLLTQTSSGQTLKPNSRKGMRRSRSCGDILDLTNEL